jgi:hypothetical protein
MDVLGVFKQLANFLQERIPHGQLRSLLSRGVVVSEDVQADNRRLIARRPCPGHTEQSNEKT